ncbi:MAG: copper-translocating P-type ATPase [Pirellula sp.]|nr:copper-translocating P-type ATPase [Pirellula sp.]
MAAKTCEHCGLPVAGTSDLDRSTEAVYCCFGCRFAAEMLGGNSAGAGNGLFRLAMSIFLSLNVMIFTMFLWSQDVYDDDATQSPSAVIMWGVSRYLCLLLSTPVFVLLGGPLAAEAWRGFRRGWVSTDLLLIVGTLAAYIYSIHSTVRSSGPVYYEVGCAILVFVTLGRWLEAQGKQRATEALKSLERLLPETVRRFEGAELVDIPLDDVCIGDRLFVRDGERIPVDGRITSGLALIDAQLLTGESRPQLRETGDAVIGGTLNLDGALTVTVEAPPRGGTWQRLHQCILQARLDKGRHERIADQVVRVFIPLVCLTAGVTFAYHTYAHGFDHGLLAALAVLLIACPCALGLATPMAVWAALGTAATRQVLFRNGEALERLASARVIAFDKTGTLTDGRPTVDRLEILHEHDITEILSRVGAAAAGSSHELSQAVHAFCTTQSGKTAIGCQVRSVPGRGLEAQFADLADPLVLGSERFMYERRLSVPPYFQAVIRELCDEGFAIVCVGWLGCVRGVFGLREKIRSEAVAVIEDCRRVGLTACVLTGDHAARGRQFSEKFHLDVRAELLPEGKLAALADLRKRIGPTIMVGDGVNDAPALTAADVGIALGCGADVSRDSADVCLLGNDLTQIPWAIELSRRTVRIVRQNLFWSLIYNIVGIALAATGNLNPIWAAAAMTVSGLSVVVNSLRLREPRPAAASTVVDLTDATASEFAPPPSVTA